MPQPCKGDCGGRPIPFDQLGNSGRRAAPRGGRMTLDPGAPHALQLGALQRVDRATQRRETGASFVGESVSGDDAPSAMSSAPGAAGAAHAGAAAGSDEGRGGAASAVAGATVGAVG